MHQYQLNRRHALWLLAGAAGGLTLHGCTQTAPQADSAPSGELVPAAMGITTWIGNTNLYIAQGKDFFKENGLNLDIKTFSTVAEAFPAFTAGQIQVISPVTAEAVSLASKGTDFRIVAVMDTSLGADGILARNSVKDIADFKGRKVGVQSGGVGHFFLLQVLAEAGLSGKDITIVDMAPDAGAAAYKAGNIDIVYSYSPFIEEANAAQSDGRTIFDTSKMPTAIADVFAFRTDFVEQNPAAVQGFVTAIFKGLDLLKTNPSEGLAIAAEQLGIEPDELDVQLKGIGLPDLASNVEMLGNANSDLYLLKSLNSLATFLKDQGQIETIPDLAAVLEPKFVQALSEKTT